MAQTQTDPEDPPTTDVSVGVPARPGSETCAADLAATAREEAEVAMKNRASPEGRHPPAPPPAVIGRIIGGNFRVLKLIGTGAMGHVFQAEQLSLGKMVALKLLRRELQNDEKLIKRFELEAKNASSLDHPNSIHIIDFGRDGDLLYIAMELLPGVDLGQLILREGPLPLPRLGRIMDQVLAALDEAHAHGIVHRDLKPGNIMLVSRRDDADFVKVCDFGIAKAQAQQEAAGLTLKGLVCGTPEYMSPEQARGEDVDGRSDLYSVGVILYQLVTGELPFSASSPVGILSKHLAEPPVPPTVRRPGLGLPAGLEAVILHALAKEPADRPRTADEMRRALRAAVAALPDTGPPTQNAHSLVSYNALGAQPTTPLGLKAPSRPPGPAATARATEKPTATKRWRWAGAALGLALAVGLGLSRPGPVANLFRATPLGATHVPPVEGEVESRLEPVGPVYPPPARPAAPAGEVVAGPAAEAELVEAPIVVEDKDKARRGVGKARNRRAGKLGKPGAADAPLQMDAPIVEAPVAPVESGPARASARPVSRAEAMKEAERLLAAGDIAGACEKGEDQRRATPEAAGVYKFLGKCYMRGGQPEKAMANYRRYLELAPNASDAAFVRSIVR
jgi:serine/threonine protein kinase